MPITYDEGLFVFEVAGSTNDSLAAELRVLLHDCRFTDVVRLTEELGPEPGDAAARATWRELLRLRSVALVVVVRYADAEAACARVLTSADADGDRVSRVMVLGYGIAAAYFLGRVDEAVARLDEVLAAAEDMPPGQDRVMAYTAAAVGAGMIGLTELSDQLMDGLVRQVAAAPTGVTGPGVALFLHSLMTTRRCQLALRWEQHDPAMAGQLYRSVISHFGELGVDLRPGTCRDLSVDRSAALYAAHLCFAKVAIGESADIESIVRSRKVTGSIDSFDAVSATTEIMWGLCQVRLAFSTDAVDSSNRPEWLALLRSLAELAGRTGTLVLQAEVMRAFLAVAGQDADPLLSAAMRERHEAVLNELNWTARLERARFAGLRSRTMRRLVTGLDDQASGVGDP